MFHLRAFIFAGIAVIRVSCLPIFSVDDSAVSYLLAAPYPSNEYEHFFNRDLLLEKESQFELRTLVLDEDEKIVNNYLHYLKWREFKRSFNSGFPPSRPIEEEINEIKDTELYKELVKMPKGGNLHSHEDHQLSKKRLLEICFASEDFKYMYMKSPSAATDPWQLGFYATPPSNEWIKLQGSDWTIDRILPVQTLLSLLTANETKYPTDSSGRWRLINQLWSRCSGDLTSNIKIRPVYLREIMKQSLSEGVSYLESRRNMNSDRLYRINTDPRFSSTFGRERVPDANGTLEIILAKEVSENFTRDYPAWIGFKRISYTNRGRTLLRFQQDLNESLRLHNLFPNDLIGFDAVGEEDFGRNSLYYLPEYLQLYSNKSAVAMPLYLHTAETNWPIDLMASAFDDDLLPTIQNAIESVLLRSKRIGHANGFDKYPFLLAMLRARKVAIEVCAISNMILGFNADLRSHQGQGFYRMGVPIVLSPDDPGTFGYDNFTVDWYSVYTSWGFNLADLKQVALNSLIYTGMTALERHNAINIKFLPSWDVYIRDMKAKACSRDYDAERLGENRTIRFVRMMPSIGAASTPTKVHIYGRSFEVAICKKPKCKFGEAEVEAEYVSNTELTCYSSPCKGCPKEVKVQISLDGSTYFATNFTFGYKYKSLSQTINPVKPSTKMGVKYI